MSYEDGAAQDPFKDEDDAGLGLETDEKEQETNSEETRADQNSSSNTSQDGHLTSGIEQPVAVSVPKISDVAVSQSYSNEELAEIIMDREYHEEAPGVPYAMWRNGTSTGRGRTTIELNEDVDDLVKKAQREFEQQYDAEITKADLRELALVFGLMNPTEVFEMAKEWGLHHDG